MLVGLQSLSREMCRSRGGRLVVQGEILTLINKTDRGVV